MLSDENELSYQIRGCIFTAYNELGPGLLESVYEAVLAHLLHEQGCDVKCQVPLPITFHGKQLNMGFRIDLLVDNRVIVEVKSVDELKSVHHKQLLTYLKLSGLKLGLLVNFNSADITKSIFRKVNGL